MMNPKNSFFEGINSFRSMKINEMPPPDENNIPKTRTGLGG